MFGPKKLTALPKIFFRIVIADFEVENKVGNPKYFQKTFLIANTIIKIDLKKLFFKHNNINKIFDDKTLI